VVRAFRGHSIGDIVSDQVQITAILNGEFAGYVRKIAVNAPSQHGEA